MYLVKTSTLKRQTLNNYGKFRAHRIKVIQGMDAFSIYNKSVKLKGKGVHFMSNERMDVVIILSAKINEMILGFDNGTPL